MPSASLALGTILDKYTDTQDVRRAAAPISKHTGYWPRCKICGRWSAVCERDALSPV